MKNIIAIVGSIGSGKGTVGEYLNKHHNFKQDSFAKPLKDAVSVIFGWDRELLSGKTVESRKWREEKDLYWSNVVKSDLTPRLALQLFGTECIRKVFHQNVWSASLIKRYEENDNNVIVTDCRFKNEVKAIKECGGYVIKVERDPLPDWYEKYTNLYYSKDFDKIEKLRKSGFFPHVSETDWIGSRFNYIIKNNGTLYELYEKIDGMLVELGI